MRKEIRVADEEKGLVQITTYDERWYAKPSTDIKTKLPMFKFVPSVTWICSYYYTSPYLIKWIAEKGLTEAEAIKHAAGNRGTKVHLAVADIMLGKEVRIDSMYPNRDKGVDEELTTEEIDCIQSYITWKEETEVHSDIEVIAFEVAVFSDIHNYAGTVDFICKITNRATKEEVYWLIDFKTSQSVTTEARMQVSAYRETIMNGENGYQKLPPGVDLKLGILQLGYKMNKKRFKFTEVIPCFHLFKAAQVVWKEEAGSQSVYQKDYPVIISPARKDPQAPEEEIITQD
jgi:hypothetical protein